jgi:hypothetical protein
MTFAHASPNAKYHWFGWYTRDTLPWCHQFWWHMVLWDPVYGLPLQRRSKSLSYGPPLCLVYQTYVVESNPGPDGGPCVSCGLTPAPGKRALLRCREGCGRECHYKEACSGRRRGEQHQGIWACGVCVVVSGGVAPAQPQSSQVPPLAAFSQPFGQPGSLPSQTGSNSKTKLHHLAHRVAPGEGCCAGRCGSVPPWERRWG